MIPAEFDYKRAASADEAIASLAEHGDEAKLLAGGHSLLPLMKLRLASPAVLIDIGRLTDLSYIRDGGDHLAIGALTRHRDVETSRPRQAARAAARPRHVPRRRSAGAPPGHHRRLAGPRRPGRPTCRPPCSRSARRYVAQGPNGSGRSPPADFFTASSSRPWRPTSS